MKKSFSVVLLCALSLAALERYSFTCNDGYTFSAVKEGTKMRLRLPRKTVTLSQVETKDALKYSDGEMSLLFQNRQSYIAFDAFGYFACDYTLQRTERTGARNRFDFHAIGRHHDWRLTLTRQGKSELLYENGERSFRFTLPKPIRSGDSTLFVLNNTDKRVLIDLHSHPCVDKTTQKRYPMTVSVRLGDRYFFGCGE